jgi:hypothetical protein
MPCPVSDTLTIAYAVNEAPDSGVPGGAVGGRRGGRRTDRRELDTQGSLIPDRLDRVQEQILEDLAELSAIHEKPRTLRTPGPLHLETRLAGAAQRDGQGLVEDGIQIRRRKRQRDRLDELEAGRDRPVQPPHFRDDLVEKLPLAGVRG